MTQSSLNPTSYVEDKIDMSGAFRNTVWNPKVIITQILSVQGCYYISLALWLGLLDLMLQQRLDSDQFFRFNSIHFKTGQLVLIAYILNALTGALSLWYIVQRVRQCLDFTVTAFFIHFIVCCIYNLSFPTSPSWWVTNLIVVIIMTVLGEYLCMRTEMKEIPLSSVTVEL